MLGQGAAPTARPLNATARPPESGLQKPTALLVPTPVPTALPPTAPPVAVRPTEASPTAPPPARPTATEVPTPQIIQRDGQVIIRVEDVGWSGGYSFSQGARGYGGRTATWIYSASTEHSRMEAGFSIDGRPEGEALLRIEGMDSEGPAKTRISILLNNIEIFQGPNPLPDDDFAPETGTWTSVVWAFDAALLRPGTNTITIQNLSSGVFGQPPFFMLDYADIVYRSP